MVDVGHVAAYTGGLNAQIGWLGRRVGGRPALTYIRQMNRVNSRSGQHHKHCPGIIIIIIITDDKGLWQKLICLNS